MDGAGGRMIIDIHQDDTGYTVDVDSTPIITGVCLEDAYRLAWSYAAPIWNSSGHPVTILLPSLFEASWI